MGCRARHRLSPLLLTSNATSGTWREDTWADRSSDISQAGHDHPRPAPSSSLPSPTLFDFYILERV